MTAYIFGIHNMKYAETHQAVNCTILEYSLFLTPRLLIIKLWIILISNCTVQLKPSLIAVVRNKQYLTRKTALGQKTEVDFETSPLGSGTVFTKGVASPFLMACWFYWFQDWPWVNRFSVTRVSYWQAGRSPEWLCFLPGNYKQG